MEYSDKIIIEYLRDIINLLTSPVYRDVLLVFIGGLIGFIGSIVIFRLNKRQVDNERLEQITIDLNILMEEISHNVFAIRENGYLYRYYFKEMELLSKENSYWGKNNDVIQEYKYKAESRLRDRELLSARMSGLIQKHNLFLTKSNEIDDNFKAFRNFNVLPNYFAHCSTVIDLEETYDSNYLEQQKTELTREFLPLLYNLGDSIKKPIYKKLGKKELLKGLIS